MDPCTSGRLTLLAGSRHPVDGSASVVLITMVCDFDYSKIDLIMAFRTGE
jgi:hypothetical protein